MICTILHCTWTAANLQMKSTKVLTRLLTEIPSVKVYCSTRTGYTLILGMPQNKVQRSLSSRCIAEEYEAKQRTSMTKRLDGVHYLDPAQK